MNISLFTPALNKTPNESITIDEFITAIKFGTWKTQVEAVRNEPDISIRKELKKGLPGVTISGTFSTRSESTIIAHSGFLCVDIDQFTNRDNLLTDPYTYALFSSVSNAGLAVIVKIDPLKHKESFRWIQEHYFKSYGIPVDPAPSSIASLRFVSYDVHCFHNTKAIKCKSLIRKPKNISSLPCVFPEDKVGEMIREAVDRKINIAECYHEYLTLGFSIASGFGENGRQYFHALAGISTKYNSEHADKQYSFCLRNPSGGITIGSFYWMLKNAGVSFPENKKYEQAIRTAAIQKKSNLSEESVIATLTEISNIPEHEAKLIAKEVFSRQDITLSSIAADPEKLIASLVSWLKSNYIIRKNEITSKIEDSSGEITKEKFNTIFLHARAAFNTPLITFDLIERTLFSEFTETFNPIKEYIEKNRHRNTTGNIDRIISSIKTNTPNAALFIKKWFLSIPSAIDGYPVRIVLALTGAQLSGKTQFYRRLLPASLKKYYGESKMEAGKDDELLMCQKLIIMDDELGGKTRYDEKRFKDLTSKEYFSLRAPYDRSNMDYKRLAVLCGTSNDNEIVSDPTGNTRILPIEVISIDHELYNSVDKDELFMEIVREYEAGEKWDFTKEEVELLADTSVEFNTIRFEEELIKKFFTTPEYAEGNGFVQEMTATDIKQHIEAQSGQKILAMGRFGQELRKFFGKSISKKINGTTKRMYSVVQLDNPVYKTSLNNINVGF